VHRHVGVLAELAVQLGHERLAEPPDLGVRPPLRVEVRATLATADRHAGECVLEDPLEARNSTMPRFTDGWSRSPPWYGLSADVNPLGSRG
jgi:hypothetical protein